MVCSPSASRSGLTSGKIQHFLAPTGLDQGKVHPLNRLRITSCLVKWPNLQRIVAGTQHELRQTRRQEQQTPEWKARCDVRAGVEGTLLQGARAFGLRRCRCRCLAKIHLQHIFTAVVMNVARLAAWLVGTPQAKTRPSRFAALWPCPT